MNRFLSLVLLAGVTLFVVGCEEAKPKADPKGAENAAEAQKKMMSGMAPSPDAIKAMKEKAGGEGAAAGTEEKTGDEKPADDAKPADEAAGSTEEKKE